MKIPTSQELWRRIFCSPVSVSLNYFSCMVLVLLINVKTNWWILKEWNIIGAVPFWDLNTILVYAECYKQLNLSIYEYSVGDACRNYTYGSSLAVLLSNLGIGISETVFLGYCLIVGFLLANTYIAFRLKFTLKNALFLLLASISPPVLLLLERGNLDILVFILLVVSILLLSSNRPYFAFLAISFASLMKFYTFPLLLFFLYNFKTRRFRISAIPPILICFGWIIHDQLRIQAEYIEITTASFGNSIPLLRFFEMSPGSTPSKLVSFVVFLALSLSIAGISPRFVSYAGIQKRMERDFFSLALFSACSIVHIFVSIVAINFSYRIIYLIFAVILLPFVIDSRFTKFIVSLKILLMIGVWFSYNTGEYEYLGQLAIYFSTILVTVVLIQAIKEIFGVILLRLGKN